MERPKCAASKVTDYRRYHLSGDLDETVQGRVKSVRDKFEIEYNIPEGATTEDLERILDNHKKEGEQLQNDMA